MASTLVVSSRQRECEYQPLTGIWMGLPIQFLLTQSIMRIIYCRDLPHITRQDV